MRRAYAHRATVELDDGGDERAPGAAITVELCGDPEHEPPCPVAPHHTRADRQGYVVDLRVLFATEPEREVEVRSRIERALRTGALIGPDGAATRWRLQDSGPADVADSEAEHALRLTRS